MDKLLAVWLKLQNSPCYVFELHIIHYELNNIANILFAIIFQFCIFISQIQKCQKRLYRSFRKLSFPNINRLVRGLIFGINHYKINVGCSY